MHHCIPSYYSCVLVSRFAATQFTITGFDTRQDSGHVNHLSAREQHRRTAREFLEDPADGFAARLPMPIGPAAADDVDGL